MLSRVAMCSVVLAENDVGDDLRNDETKSSDGFIHDLEWTLAEEVNDERQASLSMRPAIRPLRVTSST